MSVKIFEHWLPYTKRLRQRDPASIDLVVIHCTELPDLATARRYGEQERYASGTGNSGHYYVDRDGRCEQYVPTERVAHHTRGYNRRSIGIELVNLGRFPHWHHSQCQQMSDEYPDTQIDSLCLLLNGLIGDVPSLQWIVGHEELDTEMMPASDNAAAQIRRKLDPGPLFPWTRVSQTISLARWQT